MSLFTDFKFAFATIATILIIIAYIPYFRDIFARKTKPHTYSWLVWLITQGTATTALIFGGGKSGGLSLIILTLIVLAVFLLSFKHGTRDISWSDKAVLTLALLAIVVWWQLDNPFLAVLMASAIDGAGYIPTIRKTLKDPWSETMFTWIVMVIAYLLTLAANSEYNFLTVTYLATISLANSIVIFICISGRRLDKKISTN